MPKEIIEVMVDGGQAKADANLSSKLGPLKINIADVLKQINEKTSLFKGMKVPVKLAIDVKSKKVDVEIGTPPTTELIKKELSLEKGSPTPDKQKIGNLAIEQVIKIAKMKQASMFVNSLKNAVKTVVGSAHAMGILVEGKTPRELNPLIETGKFDAEIKTEKTEVSQEKLKEMQSQLTKVQEELKKELERLAAEEAAEKEAIKAKEAETKEVVTEVPTGKVPEVKAKEEVAEKEIIEEEKETKEKPKKEIKEKK